MVWILILLGLAAGAVKSPWLKGMAGEFLVNLAAWIFLDRRYYRLIKNVTLPTADGTTQIDHVVLSQYGIFVIETKNMSGWIFGDTHQKTWTQKIFRQTYTFQNPLHQNYKHTQALREILGIDADAIFSVVVFVGDSTFKTEMPENVVEATGYIPYIKSKRQVRLSEPEVVRAGQAIESSRLAASLGTRREHVRNVRSARERQKEEETPACHRCGKPMALRTVRKGVNAGKQFWGCSGFPQCKSTREV